MTTRAIMRVDAVASYIGQSVEPGPDAGDSSDGGEKRLAPPMVLSFYDGICDASELAAWDAWREGRA